jgi:hypothetical protein
MKTFEQINKAIEAEYQKIGENSIAKVKYGNAPDTEQIANASIAKSIEAINNLKKAKAALLSK